MAMNRNGNNGTGETETPKRVAAPSVLVFLGSTCCQLGASMHQRMESWRAEDKQRVGFVFMDTNQNTERILPKGAIFVRLYGGPRFAQRRPEPFFTEMVDDPGRLDMDVIGAHGRLANSAVAARSSYMSIEQQLRNVIGDVDPPHEGTLGVKVHVVAFLGGGTIGSLPVILGALSTIKQQSINTRVFLHLIVPDRGMIEDPEYWLPQRMRNSYATCQFLRLVCSETRTMPVAGNAQVGVSPNCFELAFLYQSPAPDIKPQASYIARNLEMLVVDGWGGGESWIARYKEAAAKGSHNQDARFASINSREVTLLDGFFENTAKMYMQEKWSTGLNTGSRATSKRSEAPPPPQEKKWKELKNETSPPRMVDPLGFLDPGSDSISSNIVYEQIEGAFSAILVGTKRSILDESMKLVDSNAQDDTAVNKVNNSVRRQLNSAEGQMVLIREELRRRLSEKLQTLFYFHLLLGSEHNFFDEILAELPNCSVSSLDVDPPKLEMKADDDVERRRTLVSHPFDTNVYGYLSKLRRRHVTTLIVALEQELKDCIETWEDLCGELNVIVSPGGLLEQELENPQTWLFRSLDPTVANIVQGEQAKSLASFLVKQTYLDPTGLASMAERLTARSEKPVYGPSQEARLRPHDVRQYVADELGREIRAATTAEYSLISLLRDSGLELDWGSLTRSLCDGVNSMEVNLWIDGGASGGPISSIEWVGTDDTNVYQAVNGNSGGDFQWPTLESHPDDRLRFRVQKSTVGVMLSNLVKFEEMVVACRNWYFKDGRAVNIVTHGWWEAVKKDHWDLFPETRSMREFLELLSKDMNLLEPDAPGNLTTPNDIGQPTDLPSTPGEFRQLIEGIERFMRGETDQSGSRLTARIELSVDHQTVGNGGELNVTSAADGEPPLVSFTAEESTSADRENTSYEWQVGDASFRGLSKKLTVEYGTHEVVLKVTDSAGQSDIARAKIVVKSREETEAAP